MSVFSVIAAALLTSFMLVPSASASTTPVPMNYACALKSNGHMRYVSSPKQCTGNETAVTIAPGPNYVCVHTDNSAYLVTALSKCPVPANRAALTLPPPSAPVYFCASNGSGVLAYTTDPTSCNASKQFPVVVQPTAPTLANIETTALQYYAGTPPAQVTSTLTVSSPATTTLAGATVKISSGLVASDDSLGFTNANGITGSYNSSTGVLTLTGTASVANYQAALRSVTYKDSNALTATATRTISFQVNDGLASANLSNVASRTINVMTNAAPACSGVSASTDKNTATDITVLSKCSDVDGDTVSLKSVDTTGTKGSVSINSDGTIHYDPNGQFNNLLSGQTATDTFSFTVSDGFQSSAAATVTVTITGVTEPPVLANIESSTLHYTAGAAAVPVTSTLTVSSPDTTNLAGATVKISSGLDASEDSLGFTDQNGITGSYASGTGVLTLTGTASVADYQAALRSVTYKDSNAQAAGIRTVSFQVDDGLSSANLSNVVSRTISINPNTPPTAGPVSATTDKNTAIDINVLASASDPDGDTVTLTGVGTSGTKGSVTANTTTGVVHYDPNGQFQGLTAGQTATDTFTYTVSDAFSSVTGTVTVTITGVNDKPVISNVETTPLSYRAQDPAVQITSTLTIADDDDATIGGATVSITAGFLSGSDTLAFTNANGITGSFNASTGVLTLTGNASIADYQAALRSVMFSASDSSTSPAARTVSFQVTDSVGAASNTATRTINVSEAAQPPTAVNDSYNAVGNTSLGVGTSPTGPAVKVSGSVLNNDSSSVSGATLSVTANTQPANGTVTMNPDGTFTYLPKAGFSGTDSFQYTVAGSNAPAKTATATVTITVGTVVWYVDDSQSAAGTGQSTSPFNTLAAANGAAGANSIIFLYQGNATYTGGVTLSSGENLFGQPHGLTVGGFSLVAAGGSNPTITNSGGAGITLGEGSDVEAVNVTNPSGNGIAASGVNAAIVGGSNAVAVSGAGGNGINITTGNGNLNFANASVTGSAAHSVSVGGHAGTVSFGGNITDHGTGISLTGNTGAISFSGTLSISTGGNAGFTATGTATVSATITATGTGSTITTTTGTAVNVTNTNIGAAGLNFQAISSNGANPGINLNNTGNAGGLTVTGTGTAGSGGTIQSSAGNGISLSLTSSPSFTDMVIQNNHTDGINGSQVNGLTLAGSTVSGNGTGFTGSGTAFDGLNFAPNGTGSPNGLIGAVSITGSTITGSANNDALIADTSGTLNLTVTGSAFNSTSSTLGNTGLVVEANDTANATVSVTGSTLSNNRADAFQFATGAVNTTASTGTESVTFSGNTAADNGDGPIISPSGNSHTTMTVNNNTIHSTVSGNCIGIDLINSANTATLSGTISGNMLGVAATANSGCGTGVGISAEGISNSGGGTETLAITNNKIFQYQNPAGIHYLDRQGSPTMNMTITGNTIANPGNFGSWGLFGEAGALTTDNGNVCAAISGNSLNGAAAANQGGADIELDQNGATTVRLPGYAGTASNTGAVQTFLQGNNTPSGGTAPSAVASISGAGGGFTGGAASCPTPS